MTIEYNDEIKSWDLLGHDLQHFDGHKNPAKILKAMISWLESTKASPVRVTIDQRFNGHDWDYTGTIEWSGIFTSSVV